MNVLYIRIQVVESHSQPGWGYLDLDLDLIIVERLFRQKEHGDHDDDDDDGYVQYYDIVFFDRSSGKRRQYTIGWFLFPAK
jgi:hypothetical protein